MTAGQYRRLRGRGYTLFCVHTLWLGDDHLLSVEDNGLKQRYRRFAYRDLQLLRVRPTSGQGARAAIFGLLAAGPAVIALFSQSPAARVFWLLLATPLLLLCLRELWLGPTCRTALYTAASTLSLPSLGRRRSADHALCALAEAVGQHQAPAPPAESVTSEVLARLLPREQRVELEQPVRTVASRRTLTIMFALCAWLSVALVAALTVLGGQELASAAGAALLVLFGLSITLAASESSPRLRSAAVAGVAAGVIAFTSVWLLQVVAGYQRGAGGPGAPSVPIFPLLAAPPVGREPIPWLMLLGTLLAVSAAALQSLRTLWGRTP